MKALQRFFSDYIYVPLGSEMKKLTYYILPAFLACCSVGAHAQANLCGTQLTGVHIRLLTYAGNPGDTDPNNYATVAFTEQPGSAGYSLSGANNNTNFDALLGEALYAMTGGYAINYACKDGPANGTQPVLTSIEVLNQ